MKILISYFTGSGNTEKVLKKFKSEFEKEGYEVDFVKIENQLYKTENKKDIDFNEYDLFGFGYPVHGFNAPEIMLDWARSLPQVYGNKKAFIINTSAEPLKVNNISSIKFTKLIEKKGFDVQNEYHYVMPYDMIFRHHQKTAFKMWDTAQKLIKIDAKAIMAGKSEKLEHVKFGSLIAGIMRIEHFGAKFNGLLYSVDSTKCLKCNKCVNICPTNNIKRVNDKFKFGGNCTMCQRCTYFCPTDSIKTGLFNSWRVNSPYTFKDTDDEMAYDNKVPMTEKRIKRADKFNDFWCKETYKKYFEEAEEKIKNNEEKQD